MKVTIYWVTNDWRIIRRIREKYRLPQYMTLNGITEAELAIGISAEWRELMDAADRPSPHIGGWSEREEEAADIVISAVTYLECIGCRDIEQLIKDKVAYNERME